MKTPGEEFHLQSWNVYNGLTSTRASKVCMCDYNTRVVMVCRFNKHLCVQKVQKYIYFCVCEYIYYINIYPNAFTAYVICVIFIIQANRSRSVLIS